ncbi:MAG: aromatic acid exporter family protein [Clostridia bacterium]|nr:aromatic acid exporter family protein [Clostridia bacterium]
MPKEGGDPTKPTLSKRDLKMALAVSLSILTAQAFKLKYPFFTAIAALFSMENTLANSFKAGIFRILGTVIGAVPASSSCSYDQEVPSDQVEACS